MDKLFEIARQLRTPGTGCPWDLKQTLESYKEYLTDEMKELVEAIDKKDPANLAEEIGDNLMNLVFVLELAREAYGLTYEGVVEQAAAKVIGRHPHVYGDAKAESVEDAIKLYYEAKAREKGGATEDESK